MISLCEKITTSSYSYSELNLVAYLKCMIMRMLIPAMYLLSWHEYQTTACIDPISLQRIQTGRGARRESFGGPPQRRLGSHYFLGNRGILVYGALRLGRCERKGEPTASRHHHEKPIGKISSVRRERTRFCQTVSHKRHNPEGAALSMRCRRFG
jgi:hypothetical protein